VRKVFGALIVRKQHRNIVVGEPRGQ
jgi:hypothetical protein